MEQRPAQTTHTKKPHKGAFFSWEATLANSENLLVETQMESHTLSEALKSFLDMKFGCGGRIWTYDLRVMSPTSYQTAPPRDKELSWQ